jgi:hypothetical protein
MCIQDTRFSQQRSVQKKEDNFTKMRRMSRLFLKDDFGQVQVIVTANDLVP